MHKVTAPVTNSQTNLNRPTQSYATDQAFQALTGILARNEFEGRRWNGQRDTVSFAQIWRNFSLPVVATSGEKGSFLFLSFCHGFVTENA